MSDACDARRAMQRLAHHRRGQLVGARRAERPAGAFPTGVRTAETITASAIEILQKILDRLADLGDFAVEQMIGAVDDDELLWLRQLRVELPHLFQRNQLVVLAMNEERRLSPQ